MSVWNVAMKAGNTGRRRKTYNFELAWQTRLLVSSLQGFKWIEADFGLFSFGILLSQQNIFYNILNSVLYLEGNVEQ